MECQKALWVKSKQDEKIFAELSSAYRCTRIRMQNQLVQTSYIKRIKLSVLFAIPEISRSVWENLDLDFTAIQTSCSVNKSQLKCLKLSVTQTTLTLEFSVYMEKEFCVT